MRILVCGSRDIGQAWPHAIAVARIDAELGALAPAVVIHGACSRIKRVRGLSIEIGADMMADYAARHHGSAVERFPVPPEEWRTLGPQAGPLRNARMLADGRPTHGLAFGPLWRWQSTRTPGRYSWRRTGTGDMVSRLLRAGIPVRWVAAPGAEAVDLTAFPEPPGADQ